MPLIKHLDGNCHVYIDAAADPDKAYAIAFNAKTYRYGICGAMETLLVDAVAAVSIPPSLAAALTEHGVESRCPRTLALLPHATPATDDDWGTEYLGPILAVRIVDSPDDAIEHIARWGSGHTDAIVTEDPRRRPNGSSARSIPARSTSTCRPASPTATNMAWAPRSASPPTGCTPAARSAWRA